MNRRALAAPALATPRLSRRSCRSAGRHLRRAINARDYRAAYALWGDSGGASGKTYEDFAAGYTRAARVELGLGPPGRVEGAPGSRYVDVPVTLRAVSTSGEVERFEGTYTLRRVVVEGATPAQRRWHIDSAEIWRITGSEK